MGCYVALRVERNPFLLIGFTALVLFVVLLGAIGIVLALVSESPVLEGRQLLITETVQKHGRATILRQYKGLKTTEKQLRIPLEIRSGDGAQFAIDKLKVKAAPYLRARLVPEFRKGCSHYAGAVEFAPQTCGPIDVELEIALTSPYYRNSKELRQAKANPIAELIDQASFIMSAHWKSVQIRMTWSGGQYFSLEGHPWAEMQRTEASDAERLPAGSTWSPEQWALDLVDVCAGQVYSIRWRLQDEDEEESPKAEVSA